jgi:hypothetical protein
MWIKLTRTNGSKAFVSFDNVEYVVDRRSAGSRLFFRPKHVEGMEKSIAVQEGVDEISRSIQAAGAALASSTNSGT